MDYGAPQSGTALTTMSRNVRGYEAFHSRTSRGRITEYHCHDFYEFYIHIHGGQYFGLDNNLYLLKPNQFFIIPPFSMHGLSCDTEMVDYERAYLNISPEVLKILGCGQLDLDQFFRSYTSQGQNSFQFGAQEAARCVDWIRQLQSAGPADDSLTDFLHYTILMNFLNAVCQSISKSSTITGGVTSSSIIQEVLIYINNHYTQPLKVDQLAKRFGISISYLSHEFARFTNRSVYDYILYRRVMLARQMMQTEASLNTIAYQCGFNDYSNFLRIFTKLVGMSPSAYRKQIDRFRVKRP